jgi:hypothetical protein
MKKLAFPKLEKIIVAATAVEEPFQKIQTLFSRQLLARQRQNVSQNVNQKQLQLAVSFAESPVHLHSYFHLRNLLFYDETNSTFNANGKHHA